MKSWKAYLKLLFFGAGLLLFALQLFNSFAPLTEIFKARPFELISGLLALSLLFAFALFLIACSWVFSLKFLGVEISSQVGLSIYGITSIGKYIPGNLAQQAGRVATLNSLGVPLSKSFFSILLEFALAALACLLLGLSRINELALEFKLRLNLTDQTFLLFTIFSPVLIALLVGACLLVSPSLRQFGIACLEQLRERWHFLATAAGLMLIGFSLMSLSSALTAQLLLQISFNQAFQFALAFPIAWLIGFFMPGAPAGLGLREWAMVHLISNQGAFDLASLQSQAVFLRLVSTLGDLIIFLAGLSLRKRSAPK